MLADCETGGGSLALALPLLLLTLDHRLALLPLLLGERLRLLLLPLLELRALVRIAQLLTLLLMAGL